MTSFIVYINNTVIKLQIDFNSLSIRIKFYENNLPMLKSYTNYAGIEIGKFKLVAQTRFLIKNVYMFN
jgi:hypothetical protein